MPPRSAVRCAESPPLRPKSAVRGAEAASSNEALGRRVAARSRARFGVPRHATAHGTTHRTTTCRRDLETRNGTSNSSRALAIDTTRWHRLPVPVARRARRSADMFAVSRGSDRRSGATLCAVPRTQIGSYGAALAPMPQSEDSRASPKVSSPGRNRISGSA